VPLLNAFDFDRIDEDNGDLICTPVQHLKISPSRTRKFTNDERMMHKDETFA
jgi:hypothetical protein